MNNYVKVGAFFAVALALVVFSAMNWHSSYKVRENLYEIDQNIKSINGIENELLVALYEARHLINNDEINAILETYNAETLELQTLETKYYEQQFKEQLLELKKVNQEQNRRVQRLKTLQAVSKNSFAYLVKSSDEILHNRHGIDKNDAFYAQMLGSLFSYLQDKPELVILKNKTFQKKMLLLHINVLVETKKEIKEIETAFKQNKIVDVFEAFQKVVNIKIIKAKAHEKKLFGFMFLSALFLLGAGFLANILHVGAKNRAIEALYDMEQFARALDESAIVSKTDPNGRITYVNENFCETSGYSVDELIGKQHNIVRHPNMKKELFTELWRTIKEKKVFKATIQNRKKDGSDYYVDSVVMPLLNLDGEVREYIGVRYDVTELVKTRDQAIATQIAKDEFFSNMSHELRTPLNAIIGFAQLLSLKLEDESLKKQSSSILSAGSHLLSLINDILDLSKIESGKFTIDKYSFSCELELSKLLDEYTESFKKKSLHFSAEYKGLEGRFLGDWLRISQILTNLIGNAIKFTPEEGTIDLEVVYKESWLCIILNDNGIGMDEDSLKRIFNSFEQADNSTTRAYGGTGLGLAITKQLVDLMKGKIGVTSIKGEGTSFTIEIPLEMDTNPVIKVLEEKEPSEQTLSFKGEVLVAEDNRTNQLLIDMLLQEYGLKCDIANDGLEAVSMAQEKSYELILMDENMPNMNGTQAQHKIHELGISVPIVALTANAMKGDEQRFKDEGMDGFIAKPIDTDKLLHILGKYLNKR